MKKKQFKTESKRILDMMINSIYTHKEIFLRELISNASDAIDKLYFKSLTDDSVKTAKSDYCIRIESDKDKGTLTISDNGIGMSAEELERNLGTIAKSGSLDFKNENENEGEIDIIGQFGVGFYSAFMVAKKIVVTSRKHGEDFAYRWESEGADGYSIEECAKRDFGTEIILYIKEDNDEEKYSEYLGEYKIRALVKKYSDYIRYPIKMQLTESRLKEGTEDEYEEISEWQTLNSMVPLWKKSASEVSNEEYANFYKDKFYDYDDPAKVIHQKSEGVSTFTALMFIPKNAPYNYYTKEYEKGLELYSSGVMIMEKCSDLLPDYFGFVKGLVDSQDLSLNISREMLQHDRQLKIISKTIEKKIKNELEKMMKDERDAYEKFFSAFGIQLKYGVYSDYGMHKDMLKDLLLFKTSVANENKKVSYVSLKEYVERMKDGQSAIYYAPGESVEKIEMLPQIASLKKLGYEVLYLTDDVDEFALKVLEKYDEKPFKNITSEELDITTDEEKAKVKSENENAEEMFKFMKEQIGSVHSVRFTASLTDHAVCLSSEGELSVEMAKVLRKMPGSSDMPSASIVLEINVNHEIADKLKALYESDKEKLGKYAKILYAEACLISGVGIENALEFTNLVTELL